MKVFLRFSNIVIFAILLVKLVFISGKLIKIGKKQDEKENITFKKKIMDFDESISSLINVKAECKGEDLAVIRELRLEKENLKNYVWNTKCIIPFSLQHICEKKNDLQKVSPLQQGNNSAYLFLYWNVQCPKNFALKSFQVSSETDLSINPLPANNKFDSLVDDDNDEQVIYSILYECCQITHSQFEIQTSYTSWVKLRSNLQNLEDISKLTIYTPTETSVLNGFKLILDLKNEQISFKYTFFETEQE